MEIPDLVRERLGDEEIRAGVNLGDEDAVCLTPTRTLVYRGEGLLSDESVTVLPHDVERLDVSEGRRKTKFTLEYVDRTESFAVPSSRGEKVLELMLEGILAVGEVTEPDESVLGVYRFSELTVILTEGRLVKHIGSSVWTEDAEEFPFADVTGLEFEEGSVATQIVLSVDGRPQRIKAPNDQAPMLRQTLAEALCSFHDVDSVGELNEKLGADVDDTSEGDDRSSGSAGLTLDEGIDPLVGPSDDSGTGGSGSSTPSATTEASAGGSDNPDGGGAATTAEPEPSETPDRAVSDDQPVEDGATTADASDDDGLASHADVEELADRLETLTTAVKRQNKLLRKQQQTIEQLVKELRQGR